MTIRLSLHAVTAAALTLGLGSPALAAMSPQGGPVSGNTRAAVADPDEHLERLADQTRQHADRRKFDPSSARSVMDFGNAAATRNTGPNSAWPR